MKADVAVVGASFAGLACARAAARAGLQVVVLEKKASAGEKLHTTGIVVKDAVDRIDWLSEVPPGLVRRIDGVRLYAPDMRHMDLHAPGYWFWATDTPALMDWMAGSVRADGVDVRLGTLFQSARRGGASWRLETSQGEWEARYLVGADGPASRTARVLGLSTNTGYLFGVEHEYARADMAPGLLHCFLDRRLAPGYIGWALQGVRVAQVGLARRHGGTGQGAVPLQDLLRKVAPVVTPHGEPAAVRAGLIPCGGVLPRVACPGALLVGDAAGIVSPVTAGGIHTALRHGAQAGEAVAWHLRGEAPDPASWLPARYPRFRAKLALRWLFDHFQADWMFNLLLGTAPLRRAAELVYFHRKGGMRL